jgi:hypothetical protein
MIIDLIRLPSSVVALRITIPSPPVYPHETNEELSSMIALEPMIRISFVRPLYTKHL